MRLLLPLLLQCWLVWSSALAVAQQPAQAPAQAPAWQPAVVAAIEARQQKEAIPGLCCAVGVGDKIVFDRGFGFADVENDVAATSASVFRLASISKPITAVLAMQLAESGQLDLDQDVHTIVESWPEKPWPVTTRQLLAHLGGVRHYLGERESTQHYGNQTEALARFAADLLLHEPGTRYHYSTYGFNLIAAVVEARTGKTFAALVKDRIAGPSAAPTLQDDDSQRLIKGRAQGYERVDGKLQNSELMDSSYKLGGGGLCASAGDLARFAQALLLGKLVRAETLASMWTRQKRNDGEEITYGLGFRVDERGGRRIVSHSGAQSRVSTVLYVLPDERVVVVLLCNLERVRLQALAEQIADLVLPATATKSKQ